MGTEIPKDMRGVMWSTHERKTTKRAPDYTGSINIGGRIFRIAAWHEPPTEGRRLPRMSLALEGAEVYARRTREHPLVPERGAPRPVSPPQRKQEELLGDDIPF